jgi:archaellum component FlaG (FlaF/FlaG flagellin family)
MAVKLSFAIWGGIAVIVVLAIIAFFVVPSRTADVTVIAGTCEGKYSRCMSFEGNEIMPSDNVREIDVGTDENGTKRIWYRDASGAEHVILLQ